MAGFQDIVRQLEDLSGQIKAADGEVTEATALRERAETALQSARDAEERATGAARDLRLRRDVLADRLHDRAKCVGEAEPVGTAVPFADESVLQADEMPPLTDQSYVQRQEIPF